MSDYTPSMYEAIFGALGCPDPTSANLLAIGQKWQGYEGSSALNNPWDTTRSGYEGETPYNTFGNDEHVYNYPTEAIGAAATAATISNGSYPSIKAALLADTPFASWYGNAEIIGELRTWGTTGFADLLEANVPPAPAPPSPPAPEPPPPPAAPIAPGSNYTVVSGDSLSAIAQRAYGNANDWPAIWHANTAVTNPDLIFPGEVLVIPDLSVPLPVHPVPAQVTYTVQPGDSLWAIAARQYHNGNLWTTIYDANKAVVGSDPGDIHPGQVLVIPPAP